jgi:hypothetical protein
MTTRLNKADVLKAIEEVIPASVPIKGMLLKELDEMLPDAKTQATLDSLHDPKVRRAIRLYKRFHPEFGNTEPDLPTLFHWMAKRGGVNLAAQSEKRMAQINNILAGYGEVTADQPVQMSDFDFLQLRTLSAPMLNQSQQQDEETDE